MHLLECDFGTGVVFVSQLVYSVCTSGMFLFLCHRAVVLLLSCSLSCLSHVALILICILSDTASNHCFHFITSELFTSFPLLVRMHTPWHTPRPRCPQWHASRPPIPISPPPPTPSRPRLPHQSTLERHHRCPSYKQYLIPHLQYRETRRGSHRGQPESWPPLPTAVCMPLPNSGQ